MEGNVKVPGIMWWFLASLLVAPVQAWLIQAFPDSPYLWAPLAVSLLGAVGKWIEYVLRRNSGAGGVSGTETGKDTAGIAPAALSAPEQAQTGNRWGGVVRLFLG